MQRHWHLRGGDFFHGLESVKEEFVRRARRLCLNKNDIVFFEGDPGSSCFYIESGLLRIFSLTDSGKEPIFFLRREGEMFGLSEVLDKVPRKANAQVLAPTVLYRMDSGDFEALLEAYPAAARRVISLLGSRIRYLGERISHLMTCSVMQRLIKFLISIAYDNLHDSRDWSQPVALPVSLSQEQIAAMTGSTQPTVSELLQELQREGLVEVSRKRILLLSPLELLARVELAGEELSQEPEIQAQNM